MTPSLPDEEMVIDYITGLPRPNVGAEANRQQVERLLVENKGYAKNDVKANVPITLDIDGEGYASTIDLVVVVNQNPYMVIKCAPGSLASREREVIAAARLLATYQIPLSVASDGQTALVWDTLTGKMIGQGLDAVPTKALAEKSFNPKHQIPLPAEKRTRQQLIFRTYDTMNINVANR